MDNTFHFERLGSYDGGTWTRWAPAEGSIFCTGPQDQSAPSSREHRTTCTRCELNIPHTQAACTPRKEG